MFCLFDAGGFVSHCVASYSNGTESQGGATLALAKSFICNDGKVYKKSTVAGADELDVKNMAKTRDPRFEATIWDTPRIKAGT